MEVIAIIVAILTGLASTLFAAWLKQGLLQRIEKVEVAMNGKVDCTVYEVQQKNIIQRLEEVKDAMEKFEIKIDDKLDKGQNLMHRLGIAITKLEAQASTGNKGGS